MNRLEVVFNLNENIILDIFNVVREGVEAELFYDDKKIPKNIASLIRRKKTFRVSNSDCNIRFGMIRNKSLMLLIIEVENNNIKLTSLVEAFIKCNDFIQAWIVDKDYYFWQNTNEIEVYKIHGREFKHLPIISNGSPYPLERDVIDTSFNLGLRKICNGYIEAIGSEMWLSKNFFEKINKNINCIMLELNERIVRLNVDIYHISYGVADFKNNQTNEIQKKLRETLYK